LTSTRLALPLTALALVVAALPAAAHVTVHGTDASPGADDAAITFRVPNEESSATTKVEIALPKASPIAGVYAESKPGWRATLHRFTLSTPIKTDDGTISTAVDTVTWTATAGGIPAGGYEDFSLAAGHLPDVTSLTFKAVQTYADGDVVRWIETGTDAEHPAPVLALTAASAPTETPTPEVTVTASAAPVAAKDSSDDSDDSDALAAIGLGVAVLAALLALAALVRSGRRARS
jgi:uncharacterized protein YcnI